MTVEPTLGPPEAVGSGSTAPAPPPASTAVPQQSAPAPEAAPLPPPPATANAPTELPPITVTEPPQPARSPASRRAVARAAGPSSPTPAPAAAPSPTPAGTTPSLTPSEVLTQQIQKLDLARDNLSPKTGTNTATFSRDTIEALPQGSNAPLDKVLLQAPGVTQDSAASGDLHIRNEHANLQYRINGITLPEGVSGFGQLIETSFIGNFALITGALPAQFGLRTSGVVDIQARSGAVNAGTTLSVYGGSREQVTPSIETGGVTGQTEYFVTGRGLWSDLGLENVTSRPDAIHDFTSQGKVFGYASTVIDPTTRVTSIAGISVQSYQIPNNPGQSPQFTAFGVSNFDSRLLDQRQLEQNFYGVTAYQHKEGYLDVQIAAFARSSTVHFRPDPIGDLVFNGVASDVNRSSFLSGVQTDLAYKLNSSHTLRAGLMVSGELAEVRNTSTLLPLDGAGNPIDAPFTVTDSHTKLGWLVGIYLQDEWRLNRQFTLNFGLRFDQMVQYIDANQWSPRASLEWKPSDQTTWHIGYARYFTPPSLTLAAPTTLSLIQNTTQQPTVTADSPVLPERSHYFDVGVTHKPFPGLEVGVSSYYKLARDLLDDGQFGQAYVQTAFNYDRAINRGIELTAKFKDGGFSGYGNIAVAEQKARNIVSNQFLFSPDRLAYIATHDIFTDHAQSISASAGLSYKWDQTRLSADLIYGSGLRSGFANTSHVPAYTQVNAGLTQEFKWPGGFDWKPGILRFDVLNVFDTVYEIRDGSGIGVFAPQFGPRRAFFAGISQKF